MSKLLNNHPIWEHVSPIKKPAHIARIFLARQIAKIYPRSTYIGVTGTVGKTTTVMCCQSVLSQKFNTIATTQSKVVNLDPLFNIPITLLRLRPGVKKAILEMGVEYPGDMDLNLSFVAPATGILTRLSYAHSEFLGGIESIAQEKTKLIKQLPEDGFAILNHDDLNIRKIAEGVKAQVIFYGTSSKDCLVWASNIKIENYQTYFELNYGVERVEVNFPLLGKHQISPALAAAALGISCGMSLTSIKKGLEKVEPAPHRLQALKGMADTVVLDDTYNSSPAAVEEALNVLQSLPARKRVVVLGEMRELGIYSEDLHRKVAQKIYKDRVDYCLLGSGDTKYIADELIRLGYGEDKLFANLTNPQIATNLSTIVQKGDVILVKASRAVRLDEVVQRITKGGKS